MVREKIVGPEARNVFLGGQPSFWVALKRAEYLSIVQIYSEFEEISVKFSLSNPDSDV